MPKTSAKPTTAENLEAKFDAGADVLDFFDLRSAKVVLPPKATPARTARGATTERGQSIDQLKRAMKIAERIQKLERELSSILGK